MIKATEWLTAYTAHQSIVVKKLRSDSQWCDITFPLIHNRVTSFFPLHFKVIFRNKKNETINPVLEAEEKETQEYKGLPKSTRLSYKSSVVSPGQ